MLLPLLSAVLLSAAPDAPTPEAPVSFALVVTSNRSVQLSRPPLQFADDDGAKYHEVFRSLAGMQDVVLLSEMDDDTRLLFPHLVDLTRPPTLSNLNRSVATLASQVAAAKKAGKETELYFVFAGHGDVEDGKGFLELLDARFDSAQLEGLLTKVGATRSHVILDSCNSFFVVNPRRPGGRRFATPQDVTQGLTRRLPNVGVLLSTSAEAEVFEWSELQSGIFSHAVRSGLLGAADANQDGRVSYAEMQSFIAVATAAIPNPLFRPNVFGRGPSGANEDTLWRLSSQSSVTLFLDSPGSLRVSLRDARGLRWVDAHKEADAALTLSLPASLGEGLELERWELGGGKSGHVVARAELPRSNPGEKLTYSGLFEAPVERHGRGAHDVLRQMFAQPFGPRAMQAQEAAQVAQPAPVYGISREDTDRMQLLLGSLSEYQRESRHRTATASLIGGAGVIGAGVWLMSSDAENTRGAGLELGVMGLVVAGSGAYHLLRQDEGEKLAQEFQTALAAPGADPTQVLAHTDRQLSLMVKKEREARQDKQTIGLAMAAIGGSILYLSEIRPRIEADAEPLDPSQARTLSAVIGASTFAAGLTLVVDARLSKGPIERMVSLWTQDPVHRELPSLSLVPMDDGAMLSVSGRF